MYKTINEFLADFKNECSASIKVLKALTDDVINKKIENYGRTPGRIAWHITTSMAEMGNLLGLNLKSLSKDSPMPSTAAGIVEAYEKVSSEMYGLFKETWTDNMLQEEKDMYGEVWKNDMTLNVVIRHEIHHRAQLTVLLRLCGLKVPGVYGPSKEEWADLGMPAQE